MFGKAKKKHQEIRIVFIYLNFAARINSRVSNIGLGNASANTSKTLIEQGFKAEIWPVAEEDDVARLLENDNDLTHLIISAPWISTKLLTSLCYKYKHIEFVVLSHSNVGFLSADRNGIKRLREGATLQKLVPNFCIAGNSIKFTEWASVAWGVDVAFLPNLYYVGDMKLNENKLWDGRSMLRIGSFGAIRPLKNQITAAAAALEISKRLNVHTEFWLNSGRNEGNFGTVKAIEHLVGGIKGFSIKYKEWAQVDNFREFVGTMNLLIMPSDTESFCMVVSDGIYESVPSVTSIAIDWVPKCWIGNNDNATNLADIGIRLLCDPFAAKSGQEALRKYVKNGTKAWRKFLLKSD